MGIWLTSLAHRGAVPCRLSCRGDWRSKEPKSLLGRAAAPAGLQPPAAGRHAGSGRRSPGAQLSRRQARQPAPAAAETGGSAGPRPGRQGPGGRAARWPAGCGCRGRLLRCCPARLPAGPLERRAETGRDRESREGQRRETGCCER
jgi:hypothetical protein